MTPNPSGTSPVPIAVAGLAAAAKQLNAALSPTGTPGSGMPAPHALLGPAFQPQQAALPVPQPQQAALPAPQRLLGPAFSPQPAAATVAAPPLTRKRAALGPAFLPRKAQPAAPVKPPPLHKMSTPASERWARDSKRLLADGAAKEKERDRRMEASAGGIFSTAKVMNEAMDMATGKFNVLAKAAHSVVGGLKDLAHQIVGYAGAANPNVAGKFKGGVESMQIGFGKAFVQTADKLADAAQNAERPAAWAGQAASAAGKTATMLMEQTLGGVGHLIGLGAGALGVSKGSATNVAGAMMNPPAKRSNANRPSASLGGMEDFYDQGLMSSLNLGADTIEAKNLADKVAEMSKTMGDLLTDIRQELRDVPRSFR